MTEPVLTPVARHLRRLGGVAATEPDSTLLARFTAGHDQAAFAELVTRHGPMVLATCRRILGHQHDAEDAMQATFLVLAKKANAVRWQASVAGWLHAVAFRLAQKMRSRKSRRSTAGGVSDMPAPPPNLEADWDRVQGVIDDEIRRLPSEYSAVVLLCGVESVSTTVAAERLGLSEGAVRGRLYRGREMLRERLAARGVSVSSAVLFTLLAQSTGGAACKIGWEAVANAAAAYSLGQPVAGLVPAAVPELARRVLTTMFLARTVPMVLVTLFAMATTTGAILIHRGTAAAAPQPPVPVAQANKPDEPDDDKKTDPKSDVHETFDGVVKKVETEKNQLVCEVHEDDGKNEFAFKLLPDAKLTFAGAPVVLSDAKPGMKVKMTVLKKTGLDVVTADLRWGTFKTTIKSADAAKSTVAVEIEDRNDEKFVMSFAVRKDSKILIDHIPAALEDLAGTRAELVWSLDKKSFVGVDADGDANDLAGWVKKVDEAAATLTVSMTVENDKVSRKVALNLPIAADAKLRYQGAGMKLGELKDGMPVRVKLGPDLRTVVGVWAAPVPPVKADDD